MTGVGEPGKGIGVSVGETTRGGSVTEGLTSGSSGAAGVGLAAGWRVLIAVGEAPLAATDGGRVAVGVTTVPTVAVGVAVVVQALSARNAPPAKARSIRFTVFND